MGFEGYACIFGERDHGDDIVMPGAFAQSLRNKGTSGVRLLFQHDPHVSIGGLLRLVEDGRGLKVAGQFSDDAPIGLLVSKAIDGLSIGFRTVRAERDPLTGYRQLWEIDLWEISIVTFPMMEGARFCLTEDVEHA